MKHVLNFFHTNFDLPWAWAIVATTVLVRMILVPLTIRQIHSMQNLQQLAPQMKEIQKKYKHDKQKQNEELMKFYRENKHQPGCVVPADAPAAPGLHRALLHAQALQLELRDQPERPARRSLVAPPSSRTSRSRHDRALGRLRAARRLRREPDGLDALHGPDGRQVAAHALHGHAARLRLRDRALPGRPRSLLGDDEPLDGRAGADHAAAGRRGRRRRLPSDAVRGRRRRTTARAATARAPKGRRRSRLRRPPRSSRARCAARRSARAGDERYLGGPDGRGDRGDGRGGEVGRAARARAAPSRARQGRGAVRGRLGRASAGSSVSATSRLASSRICPPRPRRQRPAPSRDRGERPGRRGARAGRADRRRRSASTRTRSCIDEAEDTIVVTVLGGPTSDSSSADTARRSTRSSTSST